VEETTKAESRKQKAGDTLERLRAQIIFLLCEFTSAETQRMLRTCKRLILLCELALSTEWARLLQETERFARWHIKRLIWRGDERGLLPDGYDASSVAAEAVAELWIAMSEDGRGTESSTAKSRTTQEALRRGVRTIVDRCIIARNARY